MPQAKDGGRENFSAEYIGFPTRRDILCPCPFGRRGIFSENSTLLSLRDISPVRGISATMRGFFFMGNGNGCFHLYGLSPSHFLAEMPVPSSEGAKISFVQVLQNGQTVPYTAGTKNPSTAHAVPTLWGNRPFDKGGLTCPYRFDEKFGREDWARHSTK